MSFIGLRNRLTFAGAANEYLGTAGRPNDILGEWLLLWYADDQVAGTAPALQDQALRWRSAFGVPTFPYPVPDARLVPGAALSFAMGEPDVHHAEVAVSAGQYAWYVAASGGGALLTERTDLVVLRVR